MTDSIVLPPNSKAIPLTQGKFAIVDAEDYDWLIQWKWSASKCKDCYYYAVARINGPRVKLHRLICGEPESVFFVDHINGNTLDNRRSNLRICSSKENSRNSKIRENVKGRSSKYKGVGWFKKYSKWRAQCGVDYVNYHLGYFDKEEDAAKAYNDFARKHFGEFARLNVIL